MKALRLATILTICFTGITPIAASRDDDRSSGKPYLALGDSVTFGFMPQAGFEYVNAANFIGYPDYVGPALRLTAVNAGCPGETTGSFLSAAAPDRGCRAFRAQSLPLHVAYDGTQAEFASAFLQANPKTQLVTLQLGANDLFALQAQCAGDFACIVGALPATLAQLEQNLLTAIAGIRAAGFDRTLVVLTYYPLDLNDLQTTALIHALNDALTDAAARGGAIVADTFAPFARASATPQALGSPCRAGLLKANPANPATCDVHPSQSGQRLIADAVANLLRKASHHDD
jgi:lysophospholipase L1-like esterase